MSMLMLIKKALSISFAAHRQAVTDALASLVIGSDVLNRKAASLVKFALVPTSVSGQLVEPCSSESPLQADVNFFGVRRHARPSVARTATRQCCDGSTRRLTLLFVHRECRFLAPCCITTRAFVLAYFVCTLLHPNIFLFRKNRSGV